MIALVATTCRRHEDISPARGEAWYSQHEDPIMRLHQIIMGRPAIQWVEPGLSMQFVPGFERFDQDTQKAYAEAERLCAHMGVINVAIAKEKGALDGALISVRYLLAREGLVTSSGSMLSIDFIPDDGLVTLLRSQGHTLKQLPRPNWYVESNQWK
jgi:hypothetical protein